MKVVRTLVMGTAVWLVAAGGVATRMARQSLREIPWPEFVAQNGHGMGMTGRIDTIQYSLDGSLILTCDGAAVKVWDAVSRRLLRDVPVTAADAAWGPDNRILALARRKVEIRKTDGTLVRGLESGTSSFRAVAWVGDVVAGQIDSKIGVESDTIEVWRASTGAHLRSYHVGGRISRMQLSPDGIWLAAIAESFDDEHTQFPRHALAIVNVASGEELQHVDFDVIRQLAWRPDSQGFVATTDGHQMATWTLNPLGHGELRDIPAVTFLDWSPDGGRIAGSTMDGSLITWQAQSGELLAEAQANSDVTTMVRWSRDGRTLATTGFDNAIELWDSTGLSHVATLSSPAHSVLGVAWSPDGKRLASTSSLGRLHIWDIASGTLLHAVDGPPKVSAGLAWSPDGNRVAFSTMLSSIRLVDPASGKIERESDAENSPALAWSPDSQVLAAATYNGVAIDFWNAAELKLVRRSVASGSAHSVCWSPDGRSAAVAAGASIYVVNPADGTTVLSLHGPMTEVWSVAWSPDGRTLASSGFDPDVLLWQASNGQLLRTLKGHESSVRAVAWSPDSSTVASGGVDGSVRLWNAADGSQRLALSGHTSEVYAVAWSPDGRTLASGGLDASIRLWDAATGQPAKVLTVLGHDDWITYRPHTLEAMGSKHAEDLVWLRVPGSEPLKPFSERDTFRPSLAKAIGSAIHDLWLLFAAGWLVCCALAYLAMASMASSSLPASDHRP